MVNILRPVLQRISLLVLVFILMMPLSVTTDTVWASQADIPESRTQGAMSKMFVDSEDADMGFTLIAPYGEKNVFLVDNEGTVVHTWRSNRFTSGTTELLEDGTLIRGRSGATGQPPGLQLLDWDGSVLWEYTPPDPYRWHHDVEPLPDGNYLINVMVHYSETEALDLGRDPDIARDILPVEPILEIRPNGTTGGDIVWMWDPLDHYIQDFSPEKPNFGVVEDHPELIDLNFPREFPTEWQHANAVSYNAELDQVMITNRNFDELWVIDHNTTTDEAAGHTGGGRGMGGDLLYRWGNPQAYGAGDSTDQALWGPHDGHWIGPGLPGAGNIIVFNNGMNMFATRPEGAYSSVEELVPPVNATGGYDLDMGSAFGPSDSLWRYNASPPKSFFAWAMGGAERLPDGHTLVCGGSSGYDFEVDLKNEVVWEYESNSIFKMSRYYPPSLEIFEDPEATEDVELRIDLSFLISDPDTAKEDLVISEDSFFANILDNELVMVYPDGVTTDVINLTVSDGVFEVGRRVRVNITPVNDPPFLAPIADIAVVEAVPYILDLEQFILDMDTDIYQMSISVNSSFVTVERTKLRFLYPDGVLNDSVLMSVNDGDHEVSTEIHVIVTPVNDPPIVGRIQDQEGVEDVPWTIDLGKYIRDVDNPIEDISLASASPYASVSGLELSLLYPDGVTRDVVSLTVSDGESHTVASFNVTIEPVNDPPMIEDIPPLTVTEDEPFSLDIGPSIVDVDTPKEDLVLKVDSPFIAVGGLVLRFLYPDGVIQDEVVVEVWDGELNSSTTLVVTIAPVNDPPVIGDLPPLTVREDEPFSLDIGAAITDIDTPMEKLTLSVDSPFVYVDGLILILLYPEGVLRDEVVVEVWDWDLHAGTTLVVTIAPVNDPPWWGALPDMDAVEDVEGGFDLGPYLNDFDTPIPELEVEVDSPHGWMEGHVFKVIYPNGVLGEQVTFTLTDGEFRVVLVRTVTVSPVNDAPDLSSGFVDPPGGVAGTVFTFTVVFKDIDAGSADPIVTVVVDDATFRCTRDEIDARPYDEGVVFSYETDLGAGTHSFHFTADDGNGGTVATGTLSVIAREVPEGSDMTGPSILMIVPLVIGTVVVVVVILVMRKRGGRRVPLVETPGRD